MNIRSIQARNFMSFKELNFDFPNSGLYFIGGEVAGGSVSNSNRAGKSAFIEALCFGLFGKTIRGIGKDEVINWQTGKNCAVAVEFESDDGVWHTIVRCRDDEECTNELMFLKEKVDLTGSDTRVTQEAINKVIGMNWLVFSTAVIFGSQALRFSEARPNEKAEILDEIMMFHLWLEAQEKVKQDLKDLRKITIELDGEYRAVKSAMDVCIGQLEDFREKKTEWEKEWAKAAETVAGLVAKAEAAKLEMHTTKGAADKMKLEIEELKVDAKKLADITQKTIKEREGALRQFAEASSKAHLSVQVIERDLNEVCEWLASADALAMGRRCTQCGQEITVESVEKCEEHYAEQSKSLSDELAIEKGIWQKAKEIETNESAAWDEKIAKAHKTEEDIREVIETHRLDYDEKMEKVRDLMHNIDSLNKDICFTKTMMKEQRQGLEESIRDLEKKIGIYDSTLVAITERIDMNLYREKLLEFWVDGFGNQGIKSLLLDEILPQLNNKVAYYASALMDEEIKVEFDTEKTLKSGETRNKFDVKVIQAGKELSYSNFSGGEKQRVDVAILLALQSVIFERSAHSCNLVVFDEVFERLDSTGIERVVSLLSEEAKEKAIFVISHDNTLKDFFEHYISIKNKSGISYLENEIA